LFLLRHKGNSPAPEIMSLLEKLANKLSQHEGVIREEFAKNRTEASNQAKEDRHEIIHIISQFTTLVDNKIISFSENSLNSAQSTREELLVNMKNFSESLEEKLKVNREELSSSLRSFENQFSLGIESLSKSINENLEKNRSTVENKLKEIQISNELKLDAMRQTVDEKLQNTLDNRLDQSFKPVKEMLDQVIKGVGEMRNMASDVGDLKKVMSNVKAKGVLGEYQLESILEQILAPNQYEKNVVTKENSTERVEFAIKIPRKEDSAQTIWMPIDAKLPTADYELLLEAYNQGGKEKIEEARKSFSKTIKNNAKKISEKYLNPPVTTDIGIMFLPFEGAYAEVMRSPELFETILREYKIIITGPSTISAILNAFRMGFSSIEVEKKTGTIMNLLKNTKKAFNQFEGSLETVKKNIEKAGKTLDEQVLKSTKNMKKVLEDIDTGQENDVDLQLSAFLSIEPNKVDD